MLCAALIRRENDLSRLAPAARQGRISAPGGYAGALQLLADTQRVSACPPPPGHPRHQGRQQERVMECQ
jgi:hypothetical protein